jgi:hypothetical protein
LLMDPELMPLFPHSGVPPRKWTIDHGVGAKTNVISAFSCV